MMSRTILPVVRTLWKDILSNLTGLIIAQGKESLPQHTYTHKINSFPLPKSWLHDELLPEIKSLH